MRTIHSDERGAILVHVVIAILALLALTSLTADMGMKWVGRGQAQNAADAGALAGAVAVSFDDSTDLSDTGMAKQSAHRHALANFVIGEAPDVNITTDVTFPPCPGAPAETCVQVDVYRNQARGNPLPTWFAGLVGIDEQGVRATAMARVLVGNASDCLKPWGVPDKWVENYPEPGPWTPDSRFDKYYSQGQQNGDPLPNPDIYEAPSSSGPGSGYTLELDLGTELVLKPGNPNQATSPGWFYPLALTEPGGNEYRNNIARCAGVTWGVGDEVPVEPGNMIGPTSQGVRDLIALDPGATFNTTTKRVEDSCAGTQACPQYGHSPRIVAIPIFDTAAYEDGRQSGRVTIKIVNILGFFIDRIQSNDVYGYLVTVPALFSGNHGTLSNASAFAVDIVLVR